jgi:hypothetical protein
MTYHLAQFNIARMRAPLDGDIMRGFVDRLADINALADGTQGFVWRLQTDDGDATALRPYNDDLMIVNMSVWESLEALRAFVYRSAHVDVMRLRQQWFDAMKDSYLVLWWVPAGHRPTVEEAKARLEELERNGPTARAFTFRQPFGPPERAAELPASEDACPA